MKVKLEPMHENMLPFHALDEISVIFLRDAGGERGSGSRFLFGVSLAPHPTCTQPTRDIREG